MNAAECYDTNAQWFYDDTRLMAPGKSVAPEMWQPPEEEVRVKWNEWEKKNYHCLCNIDL